jgi:hypothetical protein
MRNWLLQVIQRTVLWTARWAAFSALVGIALMLAKVPSPEDLGSQPYHVSGYFFWLSKTAFTIPYGFVICFVVVNFLSVLERRWGTLRTTTPTSTIVWSCFTVLGSLVFLVWAVVLALLGLTYFMDASRVWSREAGPGLLWLLIAVVVAIVGITSARVSVRELSKLGGVRVAEGQPQHHRWQTLMVPLLVTAAIVLYVGVMVRRPPSPEVTMTLGGPVAEIRNYSWPIYDGKFSEAGEARHIRALHVVAPGNARYDLEVSDFLGRAEQGKLVSLTISAGLPDDLEPTLSRVSAIVHQLGLDTRFQPTLRYWRELAASNRIGPPGTAPSCLDAGMQHAVYRLSNGVLAEFTFLCDWGSERWGEPGRHWIGILVLEVPGYPEGVQDLYQHDPIYE